MNSSWLKRSPMRYGRRKMAATDCAKKMLRSPSTSIGASSGFVQSGGRAGADEVEGSAIGGLCIANQAGFERSRLELRPPGGSAVSNRTRQIDTRGTRAPIAQKSSYGIVSHRSAS